MNQAAKMNFILAASLKSVPRIYCETLDFGAAFR